MASNNKYSQMVSYHNTNRLSEPERRKAEQKAKSQEQKILEMFREKQMLTASDIFQMFPKTLFGPPITSIRRAMTNLKNAGLIIKTEKTVPGMYGRPEHIYQFNPNPQDYEPRKH